MPSRKPVVHQNVSIFMLYDCLRLMIIRNLRLNSKLINLHESLIIHR